jgi:integrase
MASTTQGRGKKLLDRALNAQRNAGFTATTPRDTWLGCGSTFSFTYTFRPSLATRLLETNHNIRQVQELMGHKDIETTMIYLHVMEGGTTDVRSPLDTLES